MAVCRVLTLFVFLFSSLSAAAQDRGDLVVIGVLVFNTCYPCHLVGDAKIAKIGPISMINSAASPEAFQISSIRGL
jgi:cytochrome c2